MTRWIPLLFVPACAPIMGGPLPVPLPVDRTSAVGIGVAAPLPQDQDILPDVQASAWGTFRLGEGWEAGPSFVVDIAPDQRHLTGGFFVRWWVRDPDEGLMAAVRAEAGWAWGGLALDLALPLDDTVFVTTGPGVILTRDVLAARLPIGLVVRMDRVEAGLEAGVGTAFFQGRAQVAPYAGLRCRLTF